MRFIVPLLLCLAELRGEEFINLTFDEPDLSGSLTPIVPTLPAGPLLGQTADLLRGWTLLGNGVPLSQMTYSPVGASPTGPVTLDAFQGAPNLPVSYSLEFRSARPDLIDLSVRQTGRIPDWATGFQVVSSGRMEFRINDEFIEMTDPNVGTEMTFDISRFAGQVATLDFRLVQGPAGASSIFDSGGFVLIPEPSTWALFGVGAAGLAWVEYRRRKA